MGKIVEYEIHYTDGNVDHIDWRAARALVDHENDQPGDEVLEILRVTRYGDDASGDLRRDEEVLYSSEQHTY